MLHIDTERIRHRLMKDISKFDSFALYGAGNIASLLLKELGEENKPEYCIVTHKDNLAQSINGISIVEYKERKEEIKRRKILVVIAVSELYEVDIFNFLKNDGIENVAYALDYLYNPINNKRVLKKFMRNDFAWLESRVMSWEEEHADIIAKKNMFERGNEQTGDSIILVVEKFSPRVVKIAKALVKSGKDVMILLNEKVIHHEWAKFTSAISGTIEFFIYSSVEELFYYLFQSKGGIIHVFSNTFEPFVSYILVKFQSHIGKLVYETYDIANGFYTNIDEERLEIERYCLQNASGICYREFSLEYLENVMHLEIQKKRLRFWDYCSDENFALLEKEKDEELSICYVGGVITEEEYPDCPFGNFLEVADWCEKNKCHLHIYPSVWDENRYRRYIKKDKTDLYFHFHKTMQYDKLLTEISKYDYGINPTTDNVWECESSGYNTISKYVYAATNKYFDYIDAGLPIIAAIPQKFAQYLEEQGVLINWTNGQYDYDYLLNNKNAMKEKALELKENLRISNHIGELLDFYDTLVIEK